MKATSCQSRGRRWRRRRSGRSGPSGCQWRRGSFTTTGLSGAPSEDATGRSPVISTPVPPTSSHLRRPSDPRAPGLIVPRAAARVAFARRVTLAGASPVARRRRSRRRCGRWPGTNDSKQRSRRRVARVVRQLSRPASVTGVLIGSSSTGTAGRTVRARPESRTTPRRIAFANSRSPPFDTRRVRGPRCR